MIKASSDQDKLLETSSIKICCYVGIIWSRREGMAVLVDRCFAEDGSRSR